MKGNYEMADGNIWNKVLDMIKKKIGIEEVDDNKILIDTADKLADAITCCKDIVIDVNYMRYKRWR